MAGAKVTSHMKSVCQVWSHLGKVIATENVPDDYYYDEVTKVERRQLFLEGQAELDQNVF